MTHVYQSRSQDFIMNGNGTARRRSMCSLQVRLSLEPSSELLQRSWGSSPQLGQGSGSLVFY